MPLEAALLDGVRATQHLLLATLNRFGVRKIDALGAPFDPTLHEAIIEIEDESRPPRSVVSVLKDGYTIQLLRAARVAVAEPRPAPDAEAAAAPEGPPGRVSLIAAKAFSGSGGADGANCCGYAGWNA